MGYIYVIDGNEIKMINTGTGLTDCVFSKDDEIAEGKTLIPILGYLKSRKKEEIADARWNAEIGGVEFGGMMMHTDRESQSKYIGAVVIFQATGKFPQAWKGINGWLPISSKDVLLALSGIVAEHVNDCYEKEATLEAMIDKAKNKTELEAIKWS